ncbi:MAG TPA: hypothetical protein VKV26_17720 [Dehalococcoidia bacterium]|nr:hypothetical protein [Dehalococcoidia bacterium]
MAATEPAPIRLEVVGGGLGEWYEKRGREHEATPYVFVDVEDHPELLELPAQAARPGWQAHAEWLPGEATLMIHLCVPAAVDLVIGLENPQLKALIALIERDHLLAVCPTTPKLGINARLARDRSVFFELPSREQVTGDK